MSKIDFIPSAATDSLDVVVECMNDWCVRANADVISVETVEAEWPEGVVFHRWRSAWFGQTTYFVRFIRVWYRTNGPPKCERRFVRGENEEPIDFPELSLPDVNKAYRKALENTADGKYLETGRSVGAVLRNKLPSNSMVQYDYLWAFLHFTVLGFIAFAAFVAAKDSL